MTLVLSKIVDQLRNADDGDQVSVRIETVLDEVGEVLSRVDITRHPLGFMHIELTPVLTVRPFERVRLHIWPNYGVSGDTAGNIHDHAWDLTSVVLWGALRDRNYTPRQDSAGPYHGSRVEYGSPNQFLSAGRFALKIKADRVVSNNRIYKVAPRVVHETEILSSPTITLVLANESMPPGAVGPLLLDRNAVPTGTSVRSSVSLVQAVAELKALRTGISL